MGNCLVLQEKVIKVIKSDGNILKYKEPLKVHQLLSQFTGHAISDSFSDSQHLRPDAKLLAGNFYYLIPLPLSSPSPKVKKKVRFSDEVEDGQGTGVEKLPDPEAKDGEGASVVRIKLVITKQELQEILQKGAVSVGDMLSKLQSRQGIQRVDNIDIDGDRQGWKPVLENIPETH